MVSSLGVLVSTPEPDPVFAPDLGVVGESARATSTTPATTSISGSQTRRVMNLPPRMGWGPRPRFATQCFVRCFVSLTVKPTNHAPHKMGARPVSSLFRPTFLVRPRPGRLVAFHLTRRIACLPPTLHK